MAEAIIGNDGRDRRKQANGRGEQRLCNAGRYDGQAAILFRSDRREAAHDAPDGAEQPHEGRDAAYCRKHRSEEHTSELQSLMRISYAVFCLKKKKTQTQIMNNIQ